MGYNDLIEISVKKGHVIPLKYVNNVLKKKMQCCDDNFVLIKTEVKL